MLKIVGESIVGSPSALGQGVELDELCRLAAQEMLAVAWRRNGGPIWRPTPR